VATGTWRIIEDDLTGPKIRALLEVHFAGMLANSPVGSCHFLDFDGLNTPDVTFWSIWDGTDLAGCGALKELDSTQGELKSMRTAEAQLGRGVGGQMLTHILGVARARGYERVSLETGSGEPFAAATRLYTKFGFVSCEPFGDYRPDPFSCFFTLTLSTSGATP
jgi:putative acetyltransferase